jgi:hypothetical protein
MIFAIIDLHFRVNRRRTPDQPTVGASVPTIALQVQHSLFTTMCDEILGASID